MSTTPDPQTVPAAVPNGAYWERANLLALLATWYPSHIGYNDPDAPDWAVLTVELPTGQACWHIAPDDMPLFGHVQQTNRAMRGWDGHSTEEKYRRIRELAQRIASASEIAMSLRAAQPQDAQPERDAWGMCCVCGVHTAVYRNYRDQQFCGPCANGEDAHSGDDAKTCPACSAVRHQAECDDDVRAVAAALQAWAVGDNTKLGSALMALREVFIARIAELQVRTTQAELDAREAKAGE